MSDSTPSGLQQRIGGQDSTRVLQKMFTGHIVGKPAMGWAPITGIVLSATTNSCVVQIDNFPNKNTTGTQSFPSFTCAVEPRHDPSDGSPIAPPHGTACLVAFPTNGDDGTPWVLAFRGWPS
jgi:hypothetical protein